MEGDEVADDLAHPEAWAGLIDGDYDRGVVRIATLTRDRTNYLLFASVELLPPEIPSPPNGAQAMNCDPGRLYVSRNVLPLSAALDWYQACWNAPTQAHPGAPVEISLGILSPEPPVRRLVLRDDVPFSPAWHVMPRLHRLVSMQPLPAPIVEMTEGMTSVERYRRARSWLLERLHFDLLAHDDWLGGIGLVAPNPLLGSSRTRISTRGNGAETVTVAGRPRRGATLDGLKIVFHERRVAGTGIHAEHVTDAFGAASALITGGVEELGHRIVCPRRGLLHDEPPGWFFRSFSMQTNVPVGERIANPMRRRRSTVAEPLVTSVWRPPEVQQPVVTTSPVMRLEQLQRLRQDRFGEYRPLQARGDRDDVRAFENEREEAVLFIRRLVARARRRILLVDPYLVAADLQEFTYAAEQQGVEIQGLISPPKRYYTRASSEAGATMLNGEELAAQIVAMREPALGFGKIDVRATTQRGLHDRFLCVDDDLWHCGHSFNGVGTGDVSVMSRVTRPAELLTLLDEIFSAAGSFEDWWARRPQLRPRTIRDGVADLLRRAASAIGGSSGSKDAGGDDA